MKSMLLPSVVRVSAVSTMTALQQYVSENINPNMYIYVATGAKELHAYNLTCHRNNVATKLIHRTMTLILLHAP